MMKVALRSSSVETEQCQRNFHPKVKNTSFPLFWLHSLEYNGIRWHVPCGTQCIKKYIDKLLAKGQNVVLLG